MNRGQVRYHQNVQGKPTLSCGQLRNAIKPWSIAFLANPSSHSQTSLRQADWLGEPSRSFWSRITLHRVSRRIKWNATAAANPATNPIRPSFDAPRTLSTAPTCRLLENRKDWESKSAQIEDISWLFSLHHVWASFFCRISNYTTPHLNEDCRYLTT